MWSDGHAAARDAGAVLRVQAKLRSDRCITDLRMQIRSAILIGTFRQPIRPDDVIGQKAPQGQAHVEKVDFFTRFGWRVRTG